MKLDSNPKFLFVAFDELAKEKVYTWLLHLENRSISKICVEGMGDWGIKAYRPALTNAKNSGFSVTALYRDLVQTLLPEDLSSWEKFETKSSTVAPLKNEYDLLVVSTSDIAHIDVLEPSFGKYSSAIVEKPFCIDSPDLLRAYKMVSKGGYIWGVDHYPYYIAKAVASSSKIRDHLGGKIRRIDFALLQKNPIEKQRLESVSLGLGYDMLAHWFALIVALGLNGEISNPVIHYAAQHSGIIQQGTGNSGQGSSTYQAETCLDFGFKISQSNETETIICRGIAGKGLPVDAKYLDLFGKNNNVVRLDLGSKSLGQQNYPSGRISYLSPEGNYNKNFLGYLGALEGRMAD